MICNPKIKLNIMRDSVLKEYRTLVQMDHSDPDVQMQLDNNRRVHNILRGKDADAIEKILYGMVQDLQDPLTNNFKKILTGSDNKLRITASGSKRKEEVKAVKYIKKDTQDFIEVATYPSTKPHSVRTYTFAVGQDLGVGRQVVAGEKKEQGKGEYDARIEGIGDYSKRLSYSRDLLGSKESTSEYLNNTATKVDDYVHGNINVMKDTLNSLSTDNEYTEYGRSLLNSFSPKFFKDMELFIGEVSSGESEGRAGVDHIEVYTSKIPSGDRGSMDAAEVYLHEVIHTMTRFALDDKSEKSESLYRELGKLAEEVMSNLKAEDLYPENATQTEKDIIDARYDYIFNNDRGPFIGNQEFLAFALTNPVLSNKLKGMESKVDESKSLLDKITDFFHKLVRVLLGELAFKDKDKNLYDRAYNLAYRLGEINLGVNEKKSTLMKASDHVTDMVNILDDAIADKFQTVKDKATGKGTLLDKYPVNGTKAEKTAYMLKFVKHGATTEEGRKIFGLMFTSIGITPLSSVREFVGSFFERSSTEKAADWLGLAAGKIDTLRESEVNTSKKIIIESFGNDLKDFQDEALTKYLIDTNLGTIYKSHGIEGVKKFIESESEVETELSSLKNRLGKLDDTNYNWLSTQAHGLGYYMATHKTNKAQNANSYNIAMGFITESDIKYNPEVEKVVSEIAALTALKYVTDTDKDVVLDLIARKPEGVKTVINMYEGFKTATRETMFKDDPVHMVEGYSSEQFDDNIELKVLPEDEAARLKSLGFKKIKDLGRSNFDGKALSLYVSEGYGVKERLRGAAKLVSMSAKGTSLAETIYGNTLNPELALEVEMNLLNSQRKSTTEAMSRGDFDPLSEDGMMPLLDSNGKVVSYRYVMDKKSKKEFLNQDTKVSEVLARSKGHLVDKIYTIEQNERVLEFIKEDMEANWKGMATGGPKGLTDYIVINEHSTKEGYKELYKMLPRSFKEYANSRQDKSIAVPAELFYPIFGYQHISIVHNNIAKKLPQFAVRFAGMVEELWMDLVKVVKGNILMKTPIVLIGNIMSNFVLRVVNGAEPVQLMKDYYRSFKDVKEFTKNNRDIIKLENEVAIAEEELNFKYTDKLAKTVKDKKTLITRYKSSNESNPVKELVDAGLYQAIVEDVEVSTIEGKTVWDKLGGSVLNKLPDSASSKVKSGADIIFLNQRTKWFKVNQEVMQLSDLIARDVQNRTAKAIERKQVRGGTKLPTWWTKEKGWDKDAKLKNKDDIAEFEKMSKEIRMYALLENYVNYSRPSGRGEEYLNRMGVLMFTKYAKRIQKVIMDQGTKHPLKTFLALLVDTSIVDMSTIQDAHILAKDWHLDDHGAGNFYPIYSPLGHIENFVTPSIIKDTTWDFLPI